MASGVRAKSRAGFRWHADPDGPPRRQHRTSSSALGGGCFRCRGDFGAAKRMVASEPGASHFGGVVALEGCEGMGRRRTREAAPVLGKRLLWHARYGHEPPDGRRLVGVVDRA